jgi:hypothetical protein
MGRVLVKGGGFETRSRGDAGPPSAGFENGPRVSSGRVRLQPGRFRIDIETIAVTLDCHPAAAWSTTAARPLTLPAKNLLTWGADGGILRPF